MQQLGLPKKFIFRSAGYSTVRVLNWTQEDLYEDDESDKDKEEKGEKE